MSNLTADHQLRIREWAQTTMDRRIGELRAELVYVAYNDQLTDKQIDAYLADDYETLNDMLDEWIDDQRWDSAREIMRDMLSSLDPEDMLDEMLDDDRWDEDYQQDATDYLRELELSDLDEDELRWAIYDRDVSDPIKDLARNTHAQLFRMQIAGEFSYTSDGRQSMREVTTALAGAGLSVTEAYRAANRMLREVWGTLHDGYTLDVIWYGDIETVAQAKPGDALQFTDASVVLLDRYNGAGMDTHTVGTITVLSVEGHQPHLDSTGWGCGWNEVAGVWFGAYRSEPTVIKAALATTSSLEV